MPREGTTIKTMPLKEGNILYSSRGPYLTKGHGLARWPASGLQESVASPIKLDWTRPEVLKVQSPDQHHQQQLVRNANLQASV